VAETFRALRRERLAAKAIVVGDLALPVIGPNARKDLVEIGRRAALMRAAFLSKLSQSVTSRHVATPNVSTSHINR
jgi:hypothetical protein